ncbi:MAG: hypothetical protein M3R52_13175, partial [Acidobacteriota bacterium]|nr:hypothetical protein [Acidobacteriota bacterium]
TQGSFGPDSKREDGMTIVTFIDQSALDHHQPINPSNLSQSMHTFAVEYSSEEQIPSYKTNAWITGTIERIYFLHPTTTSSSGTGPAPSTGIPLLSHTTFEKDTGQR